MARPRNTSRITPKGTQPQHAPAGQHGPSSAAPASASWFGWLIIAVLGLGSAVIVANYLSWLPGSPTNAWIAVGLGIILLGVLLATRWR
ncbi:cell division protein CrgA [Candidatus Poriferisodalis sp.]|uniref:cell division protein CrgA n=1 Tax=Candidatus Poriferisodalis sp. TaxID=3101277 RepID=UPI003B0263AA